LLSRIDDESKNWKFSAADIKERQYWNDYQNAYQDAIRETSTKYAPWYIIPSDKKWFARLVISEIICEVLENLKLAYPEVTKEQKQLLNEYRQKLQGD